MKKKTKFTALMSSLAMVLILATTVSTATYAWFTRGTTATASGFDFTASAASGIQVSTDAVTWKSSLSNLDFDLTPGQPQENSRLSIGSMEPVSTIDAANGSGEFDFYTATSGDGNFTLSADTDNYLVFDLYFLNQGANALDLMLSATSAVTDGANDEDASLSTRVGFIVEGSDNDVATALALNGGVGTYIWEPNSTDRSASALAAGATNSAKYYYNGISADNGGSAISAIDPYGHLSSGAYTTLVNSTNDVAIGDANVITTLPGAGVGQITKIKVFVWMEGQDVDSNNAASTGDVAVSLSFDSGAAATTLADANATAFADSTNLTITGGTAIGADYNAYVFTTVTDANISLDYRLLHGTGTANNGGSDVTNIVLSPALTPGTYDVVVQAILTGAISSRTSNSIVLT